MHFRELLVWQKAKALAVLIYAISRDGPLSKDFGLRDQMQRAAVSVPSNIAEGYSRESKNDRCHFLVIAKGSCSELQTQIDIAKDIGFVSAERSLEVDTACEEISRMLAGLIKALRASASS